MDVQPRSVWQAVRERVAAHPRRAPKPRTQRRGPRPVALGSVTAHTQVPCPRYAWQRTRGDAAPVPSPTAQRREESQRRLASAAMGSSGLGDLRQTPRRGGAPPPGNVRWSGTAGGRVRWLQVPS